MNGGFPQDGPKSFGTHGGLWGAHWGPMGVHVAPMGRPWDAHGCPYAKPSATNNPNSHGIFYAAS